jgi:hypothetical protein
LTTGFFLILAGIIWLFLVIIWMPPLSIVIIMIGHETGLPDSFYGQWLLWVDATMALCLMAYGVYLMLRCRHTISS